MFVSEGRPLGCARFALLAGSSCLELGYGRFMQTDPLGYDDGLNWYNYVGSDPINATDPTGLLTHCADGHDASNCGGHGGDCPSGDVCPGGPSPGGHDPGPYLPLPPGVTTVNTPGDEPVEVVVTATTHAPKPQKPQPPKEPAVCGGAFGFAGREINGGIAGAMTGAIAEYDTVDGASAGNITEGWLGGEAGDVGGGKITGTNTLSRSEGWFGFGGLAASVPLLGGVQIGLVGNPFGKSGWGGFYVEGHAGPWARGGGLYLRKSCSKAN